MRATTRGILRVDASGEHIDLESPDGSRRPVIGYIVRDGEGVDLVPREQGAFTVRDVRAFVVARECEVPSCILQANHHGPCCST